MNKIIKTSCLWICFIGMIISGQTQNIDEDTFSGLKFRNIGPAMTSGRIADIAINPENENIWYVAVGSGGVWKTTNSGTTWKPIFDKQSSYSIGCVTIDPNNSHTIWVGTGENVGGRHVAIGDGIYVSHDDGMTWKNMGLKNSEHISNWSESKMRSRLQSPRSARDLGSLILMKRTPRHIAPRRRRNPADGGAGCRGSSGRTA